MNRYRQRSPPSPHGYSPRRQRPRATSASQHAPPAAWCDSTVASVVTRVTAHAANACNAVRVRAAGGEPSRRAPPPLTIGRRSCPAGSSTRERSTTDGRRGSRRRASRAQRAKPPACSTPRARRAQLDPAIAPAGNCLQESSGSMATTSPSSPARVAARQIITVQHGAVGLSRHSRTTKPPGHMEREPPRPSTSLPRAGTLDAPAAPGCPAHEPAGGRSQHPLRVLDADAEARRKPSPRAGPRRRAPRAHRARVPVATRPRRRRSPLTSATRRRAYHGSRRTPSRGCERRRHADALRCSRIGGSRAAACSSR